MLSKKTVYDILVTNVNASNTKRPRNSRLVIKSQYDWEKQCLEKKIEDVGKKILNASELVKKTNNNIKVTEIRNKILDITNMARKFLY